MTIQHFAGCTVTCLSSDTKPTGPYLIGYTALETDTGSEYYTSNGTTWTLISGNNKTETLSNKTLSYLGPNTITIDQLAQLFTRSPDLGMWGAHCMDGSVNYTAYGQSARFALVGTATPKFDLLNSEGNYGTVTTGTTINSKAGWADAITQGSAVRDNNPWLKVRARVNQTTNTRILIGFTNTVTIPTTDTLVPTTTVTAMFGFRTTDTNWQLVTGNGTTITYTNSTQALSTTGFHTYEIKINATTGAVSFYYDGTLLTGAAITTTVPGANSPMHIVNYITNSTITASTWDLKYDTYRTDF